MLIMELHYDSITYFKSRIDKCDSAMRDLMADQASLCEEVQEISQLLNAAPTLNSPLSGSQRASARCSNSSVVMPTLSELGETEGMSPNNSLTDDFGGNRSGGVSRAMA